MAKTFWITGVTLPLLWAAAARVEAAGDGAEQSRPMHVEMRVQTTDDPDQAGAMDPDSQSEGRSVDLMGVQATGEGETPATQYRVRLSTTPSQPGMQTDYWIGLGFAPPLPALRAQLGLPENQGLVVQSVVCDSPAAKANFQEHDVVVTANGSPVRGIEDLTDVLRESEGKELRIELMRGAKPMTIAVTPEKRPPSVRREAIVMPSTDVSLETLRRVIESLQQPDTQGALKQAQGLLEQVPSAEQLRESIQWRVFGPNSVLPQARGRSPRLPENMSVTITREGDKPARVSVKQDEDSWEVTEEELDELPDEVRPHVEGMLGRAAVGPADRILRMDILPDWIAPVQPELPPPTSRVDVRPVLPPADPASRDSAPIPRVDIRPQPRPDAALERRLEQIEQRIDQLRDSIDELREIRENRRRTRSVPEESPEGE